MQLDRRVTEHYEQRLPESRWDRKNSPVGNLKIVNNLMKRSLITEALSMLNQEKSQAIRIVDLCGGKGGDLKKYIHACGDSQRRIEYLLLDISPSEVQRAKDRFSQLPVHEKALFDKATFLCADICDQTALAHLSSQIANFLGTCDIVSCQFALHYLCESEEKFRSFWKTVNLFAAQKQTSILLLSYPSRKRVVEWCRHYAKQSGGVETLQKMQPLDNALCGLRVTDATALRTMASDKTVENALQALPRYGVSYCFSLRGAIDDCPEFLVPATIDLHSIAKEEAEFICRSEMTVDNCGVIANNGSCSREKNCAQIAQQTISADEYQVCCLYQYAIYKKTPADYEKTGKASDIGGRPETTSQSTMHVDNAANNAAQVDHNATSKVAGDTKKASRKRKKQTTESQAQQQDVVKPRRSARLRAKKN